MHDEAVSYILFRSIDQVRNLFRIWRNISSSRLNVDGTTCRGTRNSDRVVCFFNVV